MRHIINRILFLIIKDVNRVLTLFFLLIKVHYYDKIFVVEEAVYVIVEIAVVNLTRMLMCVLTDVFSR